MVLAPFALPDRRRYADLGDHRCRFSDPRCCRGVAIPFLPRHRPARSRAGPARGGATETAGRRRSRPAGRHGALAPCGGLPQRHAVRPLPADLKQQAVARRRVAARDRRGRALPRLRPGHRQPRPRPARVRPGVHRVRPQPGVRRRGKECAGANQDACGGVQPRRKGIWRAAGGDRRVLGTGEQFWRRARQAAYAAVAGVAGL